MQAELAAGLEAMAIDSSQAQQQKWLDYLALLCKWNKHYNLTAVREPRAMVHRHLLDSLSAADSLRGERCLDVGSGAGLPGIPLAILQPERQFTLIDSNSKKTRFMEQARIALDLPNLSVEHRRIEAHEQRHHSVISRAFTHWQNFSALCWHLVEPGGRLITMLGKNLASDELGALAQCAQMPKNVYSAEIEAPFVAFEEGERHLLIMNKNP